MSQLIIFPAVPSAWDILAAEFAELALHFIRALLKCPLLSKSVPEGLDQKNGLMDPGAPELCVLMQVCSRTTFCIPF